MVLANSNPSWWAEQVPDLLSDDHDFVKWKDAPKSVGKMAKALAILHKEQKEANDECANDASNIFKKLTSGIRNAMMLIF